MACSGKMRGTLDEIGYRGVYPAPEKTESP